MKNNPCPCASTLSYDSCCGKFHSGKQLPLTALELMKSRYSAFTLANASYLNATSTSKQNEQELASWAKGNDWKSLEIISKVSGEANDLTGIVTFKVLYFNPGQKLVAHIEKSSFVKIGLEWMYDKGEVDVNFVPTASQTLGRNDLCNCGSGKKFKKCCG